MQFRRLLTFNKSSNSVASQVRRYATTGPVQNEGRKRWFRAEILSIAIPFAVLAPFLFYDEPFKAKKKNKDKIKNL